MNATDGAVRTELARTTMEDTCGTTDIPGQTTPYGATTAETDRAAGDATALLPPQLDIIAMESDHPVYNNEDDAQSLLQPAMSPMATRLASASTPAAEKAAAMNDTGHFTSPGDAEMDLTYEALDSPLPLEAQEATAVCGTATNPRKLTEMDLGSVTPQEKSESTAGLPLPWRAVGRRINYDRKPSRVSSSLQGVFNGARQRSVSAGADALRRIQKALPSVSVPTSFLPSFSAPSFLASTLTTETERDDREAPSSSQQPASNKNRVSAPDVRLVIGIQQDVILEEGETTTLSKAQHRPSSIASSQRPVLRLSVSNDSLMHHALSRGSSAGDEDKYANVSEQVNSRFKAIVDSLPDRPSFKLPQIPSELFKNSLLRGAIVAYRSPLDIVSSPLRRFQVAGVVSPTSGAATVSPGPFSGSTLDRVLETLTGDIVILGGYRGSVLRSSSPPNRQLWVPVKVGLNIRQVDLALPLDESGDTGADAMIMPSGMLKNIGPVDISRRLFKKLRECENYRNGTLRVWDYGYDWRLCPNVLSQKLQGYLEKLPSNRPGVAAIERGALVIAHSLGGIITRHAVNARPELFSGVVYAGAPYRCINILGPLRNGDAVLWNEKALTAAVNFSLRTSFAFLPGDGKCFIEKATGEELEVDFFDAQTWIDNKLSPVVGGPALPAPPRDGSINPLETLRNLSNLPLRGRRDSDVSRARKLTTNGDTTSGRSEANAGVVPQPGNAPSEALSYLSRTLEACKRFRMETQYQPSLSAANAYPPIAVLYGKGTPTVYRARVSSRKIIPTTEAYDDLVFRDGDGVVLAREAMPPPGYELVRGGRVSSNKGHLSLLVDMEGVGKVLDAIMMGRRRGIGLGSEALGSGTKASKKLWSKF